MSKADVVAKLEARVAELEGTILGLRDEMRSQGNTIRAKEAEIEKLKALERQRWAGIPKGFRQQPTGPALPF